MIKHKIEIEIQKPIDEVIRLFRNRKKMAKWQPGLVSSEPLENKNGKRRYKLIYQIGRRKMAMTETILTDDLPRHFDGTYEMKGVFNLIRNSFESTGQTTTRWIADVQFRFKGLMWVIAPFMKAGFEQQSKMIMKNFKDFAERQ